MLHALAERDGFFLERGRSLPAVDEDATWDFTPTVEPGDRLVAGDTINVSGALDGAGKYALTKVVHKWSRRGYVNEFEETQ